MTNYEARVKEHFRDAVARREVYDTLHRETVLWFIDNNGEILGSGGSEEAAWDSAYLGICLRAGSASC